MSYEVIARRWRPQEFSSLVGQDHIRQTLLNALRANRLPHALLFTGPRGTGKTSTARILAKSVRCPNAKDFTPCNVCPECLDISFGRSVNVIEIDGASNNGVDAIRELRETVGYSPASGKYKLYIIDEVHMLSTSAFNALLKTLEEPPEHIFFVMATTEVHKVPNTILSRCQRFDFRRISTGLIAAHLEKICSDDRQKFAKEALWSIARQADGSMRDAQSLLEQVINFSGGEITSVKTNDILGLTDRSLLLEVFQSLVRRDVKAIVDQISKLYNIGFDAKIFLQDLLEEIRHALFIKVAPEKRELVDLPDSERESLQQMTGSLSSEDVHLLFDMALKGIQDLNRASDQRLVLEMILMRMADAPRIESLAKLRASPLSSKPQTTASEMTTVAQPVVSSTEQKWKALVERIKSVNGLVGAQLENVYVTELSEDAIVLAVPVKLKFLFEKLNQADFKKRVSNYIQTYWGKPYRLDIILASTELSQSPTPKALEQKAEAEKEADLRAKVEAHPLVKSVKEVFKAEIKSISEMNQ